MLQYNITPLLGLYFECVEFHLYNRELFIASEVICQLCHIGYTMELKYLEFKKCKSINYLPQIKTIYKMLKTII